MPALKRLRPWDWWGPYTGKQGGEVFDYYVDPSTASSGAGTVASPYTVAQLNALSGSIANKRIGLKNGTSVTADTLNPTIALSDNALYVGVYGPGEVETCRTSKVDAE